MRDTLPRDAFPIIASDSLDTPARLDGLWVGGAGNVVVTTEGGHKATIIGVNAGTLIPLSIVRVWSTNTTATSMLGFVVSPSEYGDNADIDATDSIATEYTDRAGTGFLVDRRGFNIIARA
jgi:hypothetical protein